VYYDGKLYREEGIRYDIAEDELIIIDFYGNFPLKLVKNKVDFFTLAGHRFVRLSAADTSSVNTSGFFDEIYKDVSAGVYVKRQKRLEMLLGTETDKRNYKQFDQYYIEMNNVFYPVAGERDLLSVMKDKKTEIKKFIRKEKISFKKMTDEAVKSVVAYYTILKK
jgi:hypothetical protein